MILVNIFTFNRMEFHKQDTKGKNLEENANRQTQPHKNKTTVWTS